MQTSTLLVVKLVIDVEKNKEVKDLSVRKRTCPRGGINHDRDFNASVNIIFEGLIKYMKEQFN